ncbi:MAG: branched-chain amino acid ABC transporter permease [candidate division WOR-3 bacterium]
MNYLFHIFIMCAIYIMIALSTNLIIGFSGLLSLCPAAIYGIGAYASTLLIMKIGINFLPALVITLSGCAIIAFIVVYATLRLKQDYFILGTLAFQVIIFAVLYNWVPLTRGPYGISGIPRPSIFGISFSNLFAFFLLTSIFALITFFIFWRLYKSPFGRILKSIREDELTTLSLGKNVAKFKMLSFIIGSSLLAIPGSLYAAYTSYIDPTSFTLLESIFIISIILIGGGGNVKGPIVGSIFMVLLPEILRFIGLPDAIAANTRQIIYGLLLIIVVFWRSQGLVGEYRLE